MGSFRLRLTYRYIRESNQNNATPSNCCAHVEFGQETKIKHVYRVRKTSTLTLPCHRLHTIDISVPLTPASIVTRCSCCCHRITRRKSQGMQGSSSFAPQSAPRRKSPTPMTVRRYRFWPQSQTPQPKALCEPHARSDIDAIAVFIHARLLLTAESGQEEINWAGQQAYRLSSLGTRTKHNWQSHHRNALHSKLKHGKQPIANGDAKSQPVSELWISAADYEKCN